MEHYTKVLKNYSDFSTRATRTEYWMFVLINFLIMVGISIVIGTISKTIETIVSALYGIAVIIPAIAVSVRRLHDISKSGWWIFISFIPLVGTIIYLILMARDSTPGSNLYGPNPKEGNNASTISTPTPTV
jgi:uncharacterized membrane protein YhaH (DUF805 family)